MKQDRKWLVLITVMVGTFLGRIDQTIVNLALPKIIDDFSISVSAAGWIATAYILANAVFVPVWGKLGDTIGRKKVYLLGFIIFIIGSVLAGMSWNLSSMIVFRIIQAVASSADYPTAMAILAVTFKAGKERAQALGIWSASFAAATVFGPLIGGPLIDNFGWRSVFLINLPVGILGTVLALSFISESVSEKKTASFDIWGAITLGVALSALVLVLEKGFTWGWASPSSLISYAVTCIFMVLFYMIETRAKEPIVDFKFFRNSVFVNTLMNNVIVFMGMMGAVFLIPVFAQTFLGYNSTETGYLFMPMAFAMMLASPLGGALVGRVQPRYVVMASTLIAAAGMFMFSLLLDPRSTPLDIVLPLLVMSFGLGFGMSQRTSLIASAVPENEIGIASSILALGRNIAGAFGIAISATILNSSIESNVLSISSGVALNAISRQVYQQAAALVILKSQIMGYRAVFVVASAVMVIGALTALLIKVKEERRAHIMAE